MSDPVIFRTTDGTRWGAGKGANLTPTEVDRNFWALHERMTDLELYPIQPLEIESIDVVGNQMTITLSDGVTIFGPFTLPTAAFNWTGDFQPDHNYAAFDLLIANDNLYMVLTAHTSGGSFVMGPNYQLLMPVPKVFDVGFFFPQKPGFGIPAGEPMFAHVALRDWYLLEDATGSLARLRVATTAELVFTIRKNTTDVGTITFAAAATTGTIVMDATSFAAGDHLRILAPDAVDDTAIDLTLSLAGKLGTP